MEENTVENQTKTTKNKPKDMLSKLTPQQWGGLLLVGLVTVGLIAGILLSFRQQLYRGKAAGGNAAVSIVPPTKKLKQNESGQFSVYLNTNGEEVGTAQLIISYDPAVIRVDDINPGDFFTSKSEWGNPVELDFSTQGEIKYIISFPFKTSAEADANVSSDSGNLIVVDYTMVANTGSSAITLKNGSPTDTLINDAAGVNVASTFTNGEVTYGNVDTQTPPPNAGEYPAGAYIDGPASLAKGSTAEYSLWVDTGDEDVSSVDLILPIPASLEVVSVTPNTTDFPYEQQNGVTDGYLYLSYSTGQNATTVINSDKVEVAKVELKVVDDLVLDVTNTSALLSYYGSAGSGGLNDTNINKAIDGGSGNEAVDIWGGSSAHNITLTEAPDTGNPTDADVSFTLGFQGKMRAGVNRSRAVSIDFYNVDTSQTISMGDLTTNNAGTVAATIPTGNYMMKVTTPGYLARVYGTTENPIAVAGDMSSPMDLTGEVLLGGDYNGDGVVNEFDYTSFFLANFRSSSALVDLDSSGEVNNLDFSIVRSNWALGSDTLPGN